MFTLIAVALGGYVMIESAPDFSNYAVLTRSIQFDRNISQLRQALSSRPFYLTTADGVFNAPNEVLTQEELYHAVSQLVVQDGTTLDSSVLSLGTTPVDPFISSREWPEVFWNASFNFVANPAFYQESEREAKDVSAVQLFYVAQNGSDNHYVVRTDRLGRVPRNILSTDLTAGPGTQSYKTFSASPNGTRLLATTTLVTGNPARRDIVSFDSRGGNRSFATSVLSTHSADLAEWSPNGNRIAYVQTLDVFGIPEKRLIIQSPEAGAAPFDPIALNRASGGVPFPLFEAMGRPSWSPDGQFVAVWARPQGLGASYVLIFNWNRRQWTFPTQDPDGGVSGFPAQNIQCRTSGTPLEWSADGDSLIYSVDSSPNFRISADIPSGPPVGPDPTRRLAHDDIVQIEWAPQAAIPGSSENQIVFYLTDGGELIRKRLKDPATHFLTLADGVTVGAGPPFESRTFAISRGGTLIAYLKGNEVRMVGIDGYHDRLVTTSLEPPTEVGFLSSETDWVYASAGTRRLSQSDLSSFDHDGWRQFTSKNSLYPGDSRFGKAYLQVRPAQFEDQFFFDNGHDSFRLERADMTQNVGGSAGKLLGKVETRWDWRGSDFIAREALDVTGGLAADLFKQTIDNIGTTVLITTGATPAFSPDNQLVVVSKAMVPVTTFPADSSQFPPLDTDLWLLDSNGSANPPALNLTADTTNTAESHPSWSPDGKTIYFQREFQPVSRFLGNHSSGIYSASNTGGSISQVVGEGSVPAAWNNNYYVSGLEFYEPAVSPDGTRLAFIARERLLGLGSLSSSIDTTRVGEIIGEAVYVKDLRFNSAPVCLLRSYDSEIAGLVDAPTQDFYLPPLRDGTKAQADPNNHAGKSAYADHGFHFPSWSPDGQEIFVNRTYPMNRWFPKKHFRRPGKIGPPALRDKNYLQIIQFSQLIRIKATHPWSTTGTGSDAVNKLIDESFDPPADNFTVLVQNLPDSPGFPDRYEANPQDPDPAPVFDWSPHLTAPFPKEEAQILRASPSNGAYAFQRVSQDTPSALQSGVSTGTDYVLSGYVRTRGGLSGIHSGQVMCSLLNNQGLLVELTAPGENIFQTGVADVGGEVWTRFSAGIRFEPTQLKQGLGTWGDFPPFSISLMLYSLGGVGANAEFTGIKMEKAFHPQSRAPTVFGPGWMLHSSSLRQDPSRQNSFIFER